MKVLVVSGFLGAGKTTFIKELIRKSGFQPVVLENEYGDNEIDKRDISKTGGLKILEFMEGCVCCTKKDSFLNTVLAISAGLDPEYLVVEPTGVGKLGNILENIGAVAYERIRVLPPVVVLCPRSFDENMAEYPEIYRNQIENAGLVVFSKIENEDPAVVKSVTEKIKAINPDADVLAGRYQEQEGGFFRSLLAGEQEAEKAVASAAEDDVDEISVRGGEFDSPAGLTVFLEQLVRGRFGAVVRAKGIVRIADTLARFDAADGLYAFTEEDGKTPKQSVFIGRDIDADAIYESMGVRRSKALYANLLINGRK